MNAECRMQNAECRMRAPLSLRASAHTGVAIRFPVYKKRNDRMNYYVYILTNATGVAIYVGVTNDLVRRMYEHRNQLDPDSYTAKYNIHKLVYYEYNATFSDLADGQTSFTVTAKVL